MTAMTQNIEPKSWIRVWCPKCGVGSVVDKPEPGIDKLLKCRACKSRFYISQSKPPKSDRMSDDGADRPESVLRRILKLDRRLEDVEKKTVRYDIYWGIVIFLAGSLIAGLVALLFAGK